MTTPVIYTITTITVRLKTVLLRPLLRHPDHPHFVHPLTRRPRFSRRRRRLRLRATRSLVKASEISLAARKLARAGRRVVFKVGSARLMYLEPEEITPFRDALLFGE